MHIYAYIYTWVAVRSFINGCSPKRSKSAEASEKHQTPEIPSGSLAQVCHLLNKIRSSDLNLDLRPDADVSAREVRALIYSIVGLDMPSRENYSFGTRNSRLHCSDHALQRAVITVIAPCLDDLLLQKTCRHAWHDSVHFSCYKFLARARIAVSSAR